MKILYVINSVEGGGAALPVPAIVAALQKAGAEVHVVALTRRNGKALPAFERAGLRVSIREGGEKDHRRALRWLNEQIDRDRPDLIWTSLTRATLLGQWAGQQAGVPVVSWQHNAFLKPSNRWLLRARRKAALLWVADSASVARLTEERLGLRADRVITWPIFAADPKAPQASPWRPGQLLELGSLGRLHPNKGYDLLIDALAELKGSGFQPAAPYRVTIGGEGADEAVLRAKAADAGIEELHFAGFVADTRGFLTGLHAYLQPSRREGFCIAAHEAMQAGLPVLGTRTGEMPFTINEGQTGWLAPPGDKRELAEALRRLLSAPERLAGMGHAARQTVLDRFAQQQFEEIAAIILKRVATFRSDRGHL
ncbi:glycosyltransferase family 4 protein [Sphingomonas sp. KRR8]|uniref:glycosyltransferase family 4 protein n=1 Tax=Sphingomonas sp. KRR8 TaxID=2942996 RepID=UPI0020213330|nr:glycosyltransferase family 4 protein [Sphingomonas sp. KRR8]URD60356.1 glycosyltransferase family 4 protein [Sphingomonas sp. KRR8]